MLRLTRALAPDDQENEEASVGDVSSIGLPKPGLDIDQPAAYRAAPFPEPAELSPVIADKLPAAGMIEPVVPADPIESGGELDEGPVLRAARALAEVRLRAEENGFLKRRDQGRSIAESQRTAIPPVFERQRDESENQEEVNKQTKYEDSAIFEVPQGPLRVRLDAFAGWAMQLTEASRIVIVDGQGYPLLHRDLAEGGSEEGAAMVDSAMRLTSVLEQVQVRTDFARDGALNLPLEEGGWLGVLRCENAGGRLCIAVVTPDPLEIEKSALMKSELARTMEAGA